MKLYEIDQKLSVLLWQIEEGGGELTPEFEEELTALDLAKDDKITGIVSVIKNLQTTLDAHVTEIDRLKSRRDTLERSIDWLKGYLGKSLGEGNKFEKGVHRVGWRASTSVEVHLEDLPKQYQREKVTYSANKELLKPELEAGALIPGAYLVRKQNIQIK